ncbi:MAG: hypothetical protein NTW19_25020 [Planctomycetota bacterium]|nr:hypothetical protein [Planctomycetota bacterium]
MNASSIVVAKALLQQDHGGIEYLRHRDFDLDEIVQPEEFERLYKEFAADVSRIQAELATVWGAPALMGQEENEAIPEQGVFAFAIWNVDGKVLFVAASHADRDVPICLSLGVSPPAA